MINSSKTLEIESYNKKYLFDFQKTNLTEKELKAKSNEELIELINQYHLRHLDSNFKKVIFTDINNNMINSIVISNIFELKKSIQENLLYPLYKNSNGIYSQIRSFSPLINSNNNIINLKEGLDLNKFQESILFKIENIVNDQFDYDNITLNSKKYFPFLKKKGINKKFNKVFKHYDFLAQLEDSEYPFEILLRKFLHYGFFSYKFFLGPDKIGKTSLLHQIYHFQWNTERKGTSYTYINLSLYYNKNLTIENIYVFLNDCYFLFPDYQLFMEFINNYYSLFFDKTTNKISDDIFTIINNMIIYLDSKIKVDTVIILDEIKPEMKIKIEKIINLTEELRKKKQKSEAYVKVLFCGNFNYGNFNYESLIDLINSPYNNNIDSNCHIILEEGYKIPKNDLSEIEANILEKFNYELFIYHEYYEIISSCDEKQEIDNTIKQIKLKIKEDLKKNAKFKYLIFGKLLIEKCKLEKEIEDIKFNITKDEENEIIENLPWKYYNIKKIDNNITGYEINYRNETVKDVIEELITDYYINFSFDEIKDKKYSNSIFGYFFEEFIKNQIILTKRFLNYNINGIFILKSIYSNNEWKFIKKCDIKSGNCYLILQDIVNAPYYDMGILIPYNNNFFLILLQISVKKSLEKRMELNIELNYNRFLKIKKNFDNIFSPFILEDGDFAFILYDENDEETIRYSIENCIKCISYYKNGIFKKWKDDLTSTIISKFPKDQFTILNSINNIKLKNRKDNINKKEKTKKLNALNINTRTKKIKPSIKLTNKEIQNIKLKVIECSNNKNLKTKDIIINFVEKDYTLEPNKNEILIYILHENNRNKKLGFSFKIGRKIYNFSFDNNNFDKKECSHIDKYNYQINKNLNDSFLSRKRNKSG